MYSGCVCYVVTHSQLRTALRESIDDPLLLEVTDSEPTQGSVESISHNLIPYDLRAWPIEECPSEGSVEEEEAEFTESTPIENFSILFGMKCVRIRNAMLGKGAFCAHLGISDIHPGSWATSRFITQWRIIGALRGFGNYGWPLLYIIPIWFGQFATKRSRLRFTYNAQRR